MFISISGMIFNYWAYCYCTEVIELVIKKQNSQSISYQNQTMGIHACITNMFLSKTFPYF